jgi:hypothetical protein
VSDNLSPEERGFVAGLAWLTAEKPAVDRALARDEVRQAWSALAELTHDQRVTALAALLREAVTAVPSGLTDLHPSWLLETLAAEPTGLALALAEGTPAGRPLVELARSRGQEVTPWPLDPEVRFELRRLAFVSLEPLTVAAAGPLGRELAALDEAGLERELCRWGARTVGTSLAGAPLELRARAMASAGAPWSVELAGAAARPTDPAGRERARQQVSRAATVPALTSQHRLRAVGLLTLAPRLSAEGAGSALRVAGRLPVDLGRALLAAC